MTGSSPYSNDGKAKPNGGSGFAMTPDGYGDVGPLTLPEWDKADSAAQYQPAEIIKQAQAVNRGGGEQ